jgi:hypothetical protein
MRTDMPKSIAKPRVEAGSCGNRRDGTGLTVADLVPGFMRVEEGAVVRLVRRQAEGGARPRP